MRKIDRESAIKMLNNGFKPADVAKELQISVRSVYNARAYDRQQDKDKQVVDINSNIQEYDDKFIDKLKSLNVQVANSILYTDIKKASLAQRTTTMAILIDKIRLLEGKSTTNINANVIASLNPQQLDILKEMGKSLIKSMLSKD